MKGPDDDRPSGPHSDMSGSARDIVQAGSVSGGVHFHGDPGRSGDGPRPRQLPGDIRTFVNRTAELSELNAILTGDDGDHRVISVCVIAGTAGSGKTSLALRWAHEVDDRFPDGQLYINLRGYDPGEPVTAHDALRRFLAALGVAPERVPADTDDAAALFRSLLADRRMLVLLDNAGSVAQVRPLLPGNSRCLVVVTSRGRLSGLAVHDSAHRITLGTLPEPEAVALLRAVTAGFRPDDDDAKLAELARLCARLPLALRIAAERAATHPLMGLDELIGDLRDESALWDALDIGDEEEAGAVRSVFSWSYRALPPDAARLFRLLGLHPGPEFGIPAAATLADLTVRRARHLLDVLTGAHLVEQTAPDRFEFHDLLRAYAAGQARHDEAVEEQKEALRRLLDWYLHTADAAQSHIGPAEELVRPDPPGEGVTPLTFADYDQAVDWSEREHVNFLPAVRAAEQGGFDRHAWQLPAVLWNAQVPSTMVNDWPVMGEIGIMAARRLGDRAAEAALLDNLGYAHTHFHRLTESLESQSAALAIRRESGDRRGEAISHNALGLTQLRQRRLDDAEAHLAQAVAVFGELEESYWLAISQSNLAEVHHGQGKLNEAHEEVRQSLAAHRRLDDPQSVANALHILGAVQLALGEQGDALRSAAEAVEIALELRDHVEEGYFLLGLGDAQQALGHFGDALTSYQRSATLHRRQGSRSREAHAWHGAGETYRRMGRHDEAADFHRRAAAVHRELGDPWNEAVTLDGLAEALVPDRPDEARRHWAEALRLLAGYDDPRAVWTRERVEGRIAAIG
ncbi:ATP-binding protein [Nocardiopsis mangrovi]|uniref:ATP-binding protein n=1 Tax=Nocardiopsis mangrovi TaxID=1179818 RepID=A0ABV9E281_9ACTN